MKQAILHFRRRVWDESPLFRISGRATRREYLFFLVIGVSTMILAVIGETDIFSLLMGLFGLVIVLLASIRRLHDIGRSAWELLFILVPYAGLVFYLIAMLWDGDLDFNQYGPNPRFDPGSD